MHQYRTLLLLLALCALSVALPISCAGASTPDWMTRQGTVHWALSLQDQAHIYLDAVVIDKIRAHTSEPYYTIRESFSPRDRLIILSPPSPLLRMGQLVDIEGDMTTLASSGERAVTNVTVWGYTDRNGVLLTHGGPLCKGITEATPWPYKVDLTVRSIGESNTGSTAGMGTTSETTSPNEPNTTPALGPTHYSSISDILADGATQTQSVRTQSFYDGIPEVRGLPDGSLVELQAKGISWSGTQTINGTTYNCFDMIENPPSTATIRCFYTGTVAATDRVNRITGQVRHIDQDTPVIDIDTGPGGYDPQILEGGLQAAAQGTIAWVKTFPDGTQLPAQLEAKIVSGDFSDGQGYFFIQEPSRSSGIQVSQSPYVWWWFYPGDQITITTGQVTTVNNRRAIVVDPENIEWLDSGTVNPLGMNNRWVCGGPFNAYTPGATEAFGLNNVGLLIKTWGLARNVQPSYFYVNDGSDDVGVKIDLDMGYYNLWHSVQAGDYAAVTGITTLETVDNELKRVVKPRSSDDIQVVAAVPRFTDITADPGHAGTDNEVTISFHANQTLNTNPTVTVNGHSATYYSGGGYYWYPYTYKYTVQDSDPVGWATIVISGSNGLSGSTTSSTALRIDATGFDDNGNMTTVKDSRGVTRYEYDLLDRVSKVTGPDGKWISYLYDMNNNPTQVTVHLSDTPLVEHVTQYQYNDGGQLWKVTDQLSGVTTYTYYDNGPLKKIVYPNGSYTEYAYDSCGHLTTLDNKKSNGTIIASFAYEYGNGNSPGKDGTWTAVVEHILKPDGNYIQSRIDYEYDDFYRLTREHRTGDLPYDKTYFYDLAGNRTQMVVGGVATTYTYDDANKMTGPGTFAYDDAGNTLSHTVSGATTTYTWDWRNLLTRYQSGSQDVQFGYNGEGNRVTRTVGGTTTQYLLDGREVVEEIAGSSNVSYVGPALISRITGTSREVFYADGIGTTCAANNASEDVTDASVYDAYGNVVANYDTGGPPGFGYIGQYRYLSDATGLDYVKARYYDPSTGRFPSRDPIGYGGGYDLYAYALDNPVTGIDPLGLFCWHIGSICIGGGCHGDPACPRQNPPKPRPPKPPKPAPKPSPTVCVPQKPWRNWPESVKGPIETVPGYIAPDPGSTCATACEAAPGVCATKIYQLRMQLDMDHDAGLISDGEYERRKAELEKAQKACAGYYDK